VIAWTSHCTRLKKDPLKITTWGRYNRRMSVCSPHSTGYDLFNPTRIPPVVASRSGPTRLANSRDSIHSSVVIFQRSQARSSPQRKIDITFMSLMHVLGVCVSSGMIYLHGDWPLDSASYAHRTEAQRSRGNNPVHVCSLGNARERLALWPF